MNNISNKVKRIKQLIDDADFILIGAGAGLSAAAGIEYSGRRFQDNFQDFIYKYNFTDMYTSSFYEFDTEEEKWAYWAKHIYTNYTGMQATQLYKNILKLINKKDYFVITTNVDGQFLKAGFDEEKVFEVQGSYKYIQCSECCHNKLYDDENMVNNMLSNINDCKVPSKLVPKCPVCGEKMEVNLRKDAYFVQDEKWYRKNQNYENILDMIKNKKTLLLEFGVGFNTPVIIRFPFEKITYENSNCNLVRINKENPHVYLDIKDRTISFTDDINDVVNKLLGVV